MATEFSYKPNEYEAERASSSYLMSLIAVMAGMPLPIVNLIASFFFYLGNRNGTYFVRWHCTQALLSQFLLLFINSSGVYWTLSIIFGSNSISNNYVGYMITMLLFNLFEFIATINAAIKTRDKKHIQFWFFGPLTDAIVKK